MNVKTYNFTKYIATLGSIFLFIAPLLGFLQAWKGIFGSNSAVGLPVTTWVLEIVGIIVLLGYVFLRNKLKMKSGYEYTKSDNLKLAVSYSMYGALMVLSLVYVAISCGIGISDKAVMIAFAVFYPLIFAASIIAAIYESMSRIQEQIYLYDEAEKHKDDKAVSKTGVKRTSQAQKLLADDKKSKPAKKSISKKSTKKASTKKEQIDDEDLQDFFNNKKNKKDED